VKKNKVRNLVLHNKVDFLALQETKLEEITPSLCYSIWGNEDCMWAFRASKGSSGGILSIWSKSSAELLFSFQGDGYVGVCLEWGVEKIRVIIVNVYSKCDLEAKRRLWEALVLEKESRGRGAWCMVGDFNAVRRREERG